MSGNGNDDPRVLHALPGRVRVHLPAWPSGGRGNIENRVRQLRGVRRVAANPVTGNVLIGFDPEATNPATLLADLKLPGPAAPAPADDRPLPPVVDEENQGSMRRARIAVRGLDRDPRVARRILTWLRGQIGVHALASPLTGRVLVEYDERRIDLHDILARIAEMELPDLPGEDRPAHPLDRSPLFQAVARTVGAALGLGFLLFRRLAGTLVPSRRVRTAATAAGIVNLLRSFPVVRNGLRRLLGRDAADLTFSALSVVTLTFAQSPFGLALTGTEGLLLLTEVLARRASWRRYEEQLCGAEAAEPGAVIRVGPGETTPLPAEVIEGVGTAVGRDGLPRQLTPGARVSAGARISGGRLVLQLEGGKPFVPEPRPAPLTPRLYSRYVHLMGPLSLGYAALTAVVTRSVARTFEALLLVNPRTAIIGMEAANLDAAARVLREGVIVVGTRADRAIRRPDFLLLDGPRVLTDGLEVAGVVPLRERLDIADVLGLAGEVSCSAGMPWGDAFPRECDMPAGEGSFNGLWATGVVRGVRYTLGPPEDLPEVAGVAELLHDGGYLLALGTEQDGQTLGLLALQPRISAGAAELVRTCRRLGVSLEMLGGGAPAAAQEVARRAGVPLVVADDPVAAIRSRQQAGAHVAFVSDSAHAAPAFADCDLAVGLSWVQASRFPARADLLASNLKGVAAIVDAGERRDEAVRDGVVLSTLANAFGAVWGFRGRPGIAGASRAVYISALAALVDGWARLRGTRGP
jgi:cation transport ATPase